MSKRKERLTVTIDAELLDAGNHAVASGGADSLSGWVNQALKERAEKEQRLRAMAAAVHAYEAEFGVITGDELAAQRRADARDAVVVRGRRREESRRSRVPRRSA